jgi:hypothetical protein
LPIHPDGTRLPNWGSPLIDTGEYTYPYDQAVKWLSKSDHNQNVLLAGHYYRVDGLRFYFGKYRYFPKMAEYYFAFERFDKEAEERFFSSLIADLNNVPNMRLVVLPDKIIYHSVNNIDLDKDKIYGGKFKIAQKISNSEHSIYVLTKNYNIY